jgi:hypothetical protein
MVEAGKGGLHHLSLQGLLSSKYMFVYALTPLLPSSLCAPPQKSYFAASQRQQIGVASRQLESLISC